MEYKLDISSDEDDKQEYRANHDIQKGPAKPAGDHGDMIFNDTFKLRLEDSRIGDNDIELANFDDDDDEIDN